MNGNKPSFSTYLYIIFFRLCDSLGTFAVKSARLCVRLGLTAFFSIIYAVRAVGEMFGQWYEETVSRKKSQRFSIGGSVISFCHGTSAIVSSVFSGFKSGFLKGAANFFRQLGAFFVLLWKHIAPVLNYAAPAAAVICSVIIINQYYGYEYGLEVEFNGSNIGVIKNESVFYDALNDISAKVEKATGQPYTVSVKPTYTLIMMENPEYTSADDITDKIVESTPELFAEGYGLFVDDKLIAVNADKTVLQTAIDDYLAPYASDNNDDNAQISFVEDVEIREGLYLVTEKKTASELKKLLNTPTEEAIIYTVKNGDSINRIADSFDMTVSELDALNDGISERYIYEGDKIVISASSTLLKVMLTKNEVYEEETEIPVIKIDNDSIYEGTTKVISNGSAGTNRITASVAYVNGVEISREILSEEVIEEAVAKRIYVGTKEKPSTVATGNWIRPVKGGYISSKYGWRTVFGKRDFHTGVDFAVPKGTEIHAIDGGTIIFMGTSGGYGKLVKVDHGNGYVSFYAHCSAYADLKVGDKVYQGQTISYVGSTGRSTGNHVHLEVRYDNEDININDVYC